MRNKNKKWVNAIVMGLLVWFCLSLTVSWAAGEGVLQVSADQMKVYLRGLTLPRPQEARSGDKAEAVRSTVEQVAVAASLESARALEGNGSFSGGKGDGKGKGNGLALGQLNGGSNLGGKSSKLGLGNANLAKDIGKQMDKNKDKNKDKDKGKKK